MSTETANISDGQLVLNTDLDGTSDAANAFPGALAEMIAGVTSVNSNINPLVVAVGTGWNIVLGGTGQWCVCQGQIADYLPSTTETLASSTSQDRYDLVCFQYAKVNGDPYTTSFMDTYGNITNNVTVYHTLRSVAYTVVQGTPGAGQTATPPGGYDRLAWVKVPASSGSLMTGDITMILPTWAQRIQTYGGGGISSINSLTGALAITSSGSTITVNASGSTIDLEVTGGVVNSINGDTGAVTIAGLGSVQVAPGSAGVINISDNASLNTVISTPVVSTTSGISISLVIPNAGTSWYFEFTYFMNAANTDGKITRTAGTVISDTGNSGTLIGAQNPLVIYAGVCAANQTLTVQASNQYSGGGSQSIAAAFLIAKAFRLN